MSWQVTLGPVIAISLGKDDGLLLNAVTDLNPRSKQANTPFLPFYGILCMSKIAMMNLQK